MSTRLRINLTKEIIEKSAYCGIRNDEGEILTKSNNPSVKGDSDKTSSNCAIALAIWDIFPKSNVEAENIVFYDRTEIINGEEFLCNNYESTELPEEARCFIDRFDSYGYEQRIRMTPFSFEIEVPDKVIDRISLDELKESLVNHPTLELV